MRKLAIAILVLPLLAGPSMADQGDLGDIQRYGGHWRYQHRDWSWLHGHPTPGVCWTWDDERAAWIWTC
ncbi:MAG: hypothetical protein ACR652_12690 [Methylocystis sp.]|uniref:hypothetical protein n=1 Tax=Methylocystis sp. TaxID=1911079 RepID=UPI003DA47039